MKQNHRRFLALTGVAVTGLSLAVIFLALPKVRAATVDVTANVATQCGNGILETGETCDGLAGAGNCYNNTCKSDCSCPTCGNGVVEAGEACESDSQCGSGQTCNAQCQCQTTSVPPCVPGPTVCSWSACVAGVQTGFCTNGCSASTTGRSCVLPPVCGNGILETGEECDDGNTTSGDGCSTACQLELGCGNAVVDPGEQCDDGNTVSGDCCSSSCQTEILIINAAAAPTETAATISWSTPCQVSSASLEWGTTPALTDGSVSGLGGQNYSYVINGLASNTVYYYKITVTSAAGDTSQTGSFRTTGGAEICNNGIDDNGNGFCDYPASTCTDGAQPGDPACACTPAFSCTPGACGADNKWTVTCVDQSAPKCQPDYSYDETCNVCPGVTCGTCQQLNEQTCACESTNNCCGNSVCEPPTESPYSCQTDCRTTCLSQWQCGPWQPAACPPSGIQTRDCFDTNGCQVPINEPVTSQSCGGRCLGLSCGAGQQLDIQTCTCENIVPFCGNNICESGENNQTCPQDCIKICMPNWTVQAWSDCANGLQHREVYDLNNCNIDLGKPPMVRSCVAGCDVACSTCQKIDTVSCSCFAETPCCGNRICDQGETNWSCPVDCGIPPELKINLPQCMDGLDNDNDGQVDFPADKECAKPTDNSETSPTEFLLKLQKNISTLYVDNIIKNPAVQQTNQAAAPLLITTVAVNTFASFSFFNFAAYFQYFFTQPFAVLFRRKRRKWGVIYNALTKQPIDLAIVRLYQKENNRLVQSRVTDRQGRFNFLAEPGNYYLTVTKPQFIFPSVFLKDAKEDVQYLDLYHGETIVVTDQRADITVNIPIDSQVPEKPARKIILQYYLRKLQSVIAFAAIPLAAVSMVLSPGALTYALFGFNCLLFVLFRRLGYQKRPKNWGIIYDANDKKPIGRAITRIYDKKYNKLLETRVTDAKGRYAFLVNNNIYYVTAEKLGYQPHRTTDIDLINKQRDAVINVDIGLAKGQAPPAAESAPLVTPPIIPPPSPVTPPPPAPVSSLPPPSSKVVTPASSGGAVSRESLQELIKYKESETPADIPLPKPSDLRTKPFEPPAEAPAPPAEMPNAENQSAEPKSETPKTESQAAVPKVENPVEAPKTESQIESPKVESQGAMPKKENQAPAPRAEDTIEPDKSIFG